MVVYQGGLTGSGADGSTGVSLRGGRADDAADNAGGGARDISISTVGPWDCCCGR